MKKIGIEELKLLQLDILKEVQIFCEKNNLRYFLGYGTLIGAIRHKGYIPWDDDIDIIMPRPDYNLFLEKFNTQGGFLKVMAPEINLDYYAPYANVYDTRTILIEKAMSHRGVEIGVKIDVFPLDAVPQDDNEYKAYCRQMEKYHVILRCKRLKLNSVKGLKNKCKSLIKKILFSTYSYRSIQKKIVCLANSVDYNNSSYVDLAVFPVYKRKRFEKQLLSNSIKVEFEGVMFYAPVGYDKYLRTIYGDYMQLPPKEKQIPHHGFTAYWKD